VQHAKNCVIKFRTSVILQEKTFIWYYSLHFSAALSYLANTFHGSIPPFFCSCSIIRRRGRWHKKKKETL